jgi:hypothetical protein
MLLSALCHIGLTVAQYGFDPRGWLGSSLATKAVVAADLWLIGYVLLSSRVRQTFLDFPSA